jgi:ABC-type sugar transport system ATPase subunit
MGYRPVKERRGRMPDKKEIILKMEDISKTFPGVKALKNIDMEIEKGEVHAIVGENGAGKSTLMKILSGAIQKDKGKIILYGKETEITSAQHAIKLGISCIYQELTIFPLLNVAKNIFIGNMPMRGKIIDLNKMYAETKKVLELLKLKVSPKTLCRDLSVAQQQMIEIGRAVSRNVQIIIMDEPTSSLTEKEKEVLFRIIRLLKAKGVSVLYVSHKLEEVKEIADRITILRDGTKVKTVSNAQITREEIVENMIGRKMENYFNKETADIGGTGLKVEGLAKQKKFENVSFEVRKGEVLGMFGLVGAGRSEIAGAIFGTEKPDRGKIFIEGKPVSIKNNRQAIKLGICLVPEDRKTQGLVLKLNVKTNISMVKIRAESKWGQVNGKRENEIADQYVKSLNIRTPSLKQVLNNLSGGNQQKVVIAKWLSMEPRVLILDEPTRGIDVGAKSEIYTLISGLAKKGVAVIVISSELPEIMGISDRVITVFEGKITGIIDRENFSSNAIMRASLGEEAIN